MSISPNDSFENDFSEEADGVQAAQPPPAQVEERLPD